MKILNLRYLVLCSVFITPLIASSQTAPKETLDKASQIQEKSDDVARESQKKVDSLANQTEADLRRYKSVLKQIENMRAYNDQMRDLISSQEAEVKSIRAKMKNVADLKKDILPLVGNMLNNLEEFVKLDVPFLKSERSKRMRDLKKLMSRADVSTSEKFRRVLEAYQIENEYGKTIEAYNGSVEIKGEEVSVEFLRVGRIALLYRGLDGNTFGRWDKKSGKYVDLEGQYRSALKQGLRVAKKQQAPSLLKVPVLKSESNAG